LSRRRPPHRAPPAASFQVQAHALRVSCHAGRWAVTVDDVTLEHWFLSKVAAWEAGVREVDRLDRSAGVAAVAGAS
jgi:hypothetical protein